MLMAKLKVNKPLHEKWNSLISKLETGDLCVKKNEKKKEKKTLYSNTFLSQETRKISNKQPNLTPKAIRERRTEKKPQS